MTKDGTGESQMMFALKEKPPSMARLVEQKVDHLLVRVNAAVDRIDKLHREQSLVREKRKTLEKFVRGKIDKEKKEEVLARKVDDEWAPTKEDLEKDKKGFSLARKLSEKEMAKIKERFAAAFPKYAEQIRNTKVDYYAGINAVTNADLAVFRELTHEEGSFPAEAFPFYEILTQRLAEKAARGEGGIVGKVRAGLTKALGYTSYYVDSPVLKEWNKIEHALVGSFGDAGAEEMITDLYFSPENKFRIFKEKCRQAGIDFDESLKRANDRSMFVRRAEKMLGRDARVIQKGIINGGLSLPGKVYDSSVAVAAVALGTIPAVAAMSLELPMVMNVIGYSAVAGMIFVIPPMLVGVKYHELTHAFGGNYKRYLDRQKPHE